MGQANQELADRTVAHALLVSQFARREVREILRFLNRDVFPRLLDAIQERLVKIEERGFSLGKRNNLRVAALFDSIDEIIDTGYAKARGPLMKSLRGLAKAEARWQVDAFRSAVPIELEWRVPTAETLRSIITSRPMDGALLKDWYSGLPSSAKTAVKRAINVGVATGQPHAEIVRAIKGSRALGYTDGVLTRPRREIATHVETAVQHVGQQAREAAYEANAEYLAGVQWSATLDTLTCPRCGPLDGKVWPVKEGPVPPLHLRCRCVRVPVVKGWRELGLKDPPVGTRASMDGQVAADMSFSQWLRRQPPERVEAVLGPTRAKLFRGNRITLQDMVGEQNQLLTLDQLRALGKI